MNYKTLVMVITAVLSLSAVAQQKSQTVKPWEHGRLRVSDNQRFLQHEDGTPFFWLG